MDFIRKHQIVLDFVENLVHIYQAPTIATLLTAADLPRTAEVVMDNKVVIPARTETVVSAKWTGEVGSYAVLFVPWEEFQEAWGIAAARAVVEPRESKVVCRLLNASAENVVLVPG
jgi:hypothetical protein